MSSEHDRDEEKDDMKSQSDKIRVFLMLAVSLLLSSTIPNSVSAAELEVGEEVLKEVNAVMRELEGKRGR